jgi:cleavage stimulation factor subunit 3
VSLWKRLLEFEKTNPQKLEPQQLENRIVFTYNQCLLCLYHYPELWYDFALYRLSCGSLEAATAVFDRALEAIPSSLILHFAYADTLESQKNVKVIYLFRVIIYIIYREPRMCMISY